MNVTRIKRISALLLAAWAALATVLMLHALGTCRVLRASLRTSQDVAGRMDRQTRRLETVLHAKSGELDRLRKQWTASADFERERRRARADRVALQRAKYALRTGAENASGEGKAAVEDAGFRIRWTDGRLDLRARGPDPLEVSYDLSQRFVVEGQILVHPSGLRTQSLRLFERLPTGDTVEAELEDGEFHVASKQRAPRRWAVGLGAFAHLDPRTGRVDLAYAGPFVEAWGLRAGITAAIDGRGRAVLPGVLVGVQKRW